MHVCLVTHMHPYIYIYPYIYIDISQLIICDDLIYLRFVSIDMEIYYHFDILTLVNINDMYVSLFNISLLYQDDQIIQLFGCYY